MTRLLPVVTMVMCAGWGEERNDDMMMGDDDDHVMGMTTHENDGGTRH